MAIDDPRTLIARTVSEIQPPNQASAAIAAERQRRLTKPSGSLGKLEDLAIRIAGISGFNRPRLDQKLIVVAAADHGVAKHGVSAYPQEVTAQMVNNFVTGGAAINVLASHVGARVRIVDAGILDQNFEHDTVIQVNLGPGSADITEGPAMPPELAEKAISAGISMLQVEHDNLGIDIVGCGDMGIGNSTAAASIVSAVTGRSPRATTGRGTGIDDKTFETKVSSVEKALTVNKPDPADGIDLLASVGGFEIGVLSGIYLGAAAARIPAVVDGLISGAAALVATTIAPTVQSYLVASHRSMEPGHGETLRYLELDPLLDLGMRLGEGTGAALGISLCVAACRLMDEMATFEEAGVTTANHDAALDS